jgi:hypothetical protein
MKRCNVTSKKGMGNLVVFVRSCQVPNIVVRRSADMGTSNNEFPWGTFFTNFHTLAELKTCTYVKCNLRLFIGRRRKL